MVSFFLLLFGLVFGSFISALSWRYPRRISVKTGRSICPNCKKEIEWFDNIPLLSYLLLGGKCRNCKKKISWRYPVIEFSTAIGFVIVGHFATPLQGASFKGLDILACYIFIFCLLELIFIIDLENQIIPDIFVFGGIILSFTFYPLPFTNLFSGFLCATLLLFIHILTRGRGMGLGDVKFAVLGGMIVGLKFSLIWLFLAFLTGGIVGIILILGRRAGLKDKIAFGPFLVLAIPITLIWGQKIINVLLLR